MNQTILDFIQSKRIAVVGASRSGKKFGNSIFTELKQRGYQVFLVHPEAKEIGGEPCSPNLAALSGKVDGVVICVPPERAVQVVHEAAAAGINKVWLQAGAQSPEAVAAAKEAKMQVVAGKCILMYAEPVKSFHGFHRGVMKLFGQL